MARQLRGKISQAKWRCSMAAAGGGADDKMDAEWLQMGTSGYVNHVLYQHRKAGKRIS